MKRTLAGFITAALGAACSEVDVPDLTTGGIVRGHVSYAGAEAAAMRRPGLQVVAFASFPPAGAPHGSILIEEPDFGAPVAFELRNVVPGRYKLLAQLIELDAPPQTGPSPFPSGAYPDFCSLTDPAATIEVTADGSTEGADITLFDQAGSADPCGLPPPGNCPMAGRGTLEIVVLLDRAAAAIEDPDRLVYALFASPGPPSAFGGVPAGMIGMFPYTLTDTKIFPGSYQVNVCYDVGGDNPIGCGPTDFSAYYMDKAKLTVAGDAITTIEIDLDRATSRLVGTKLAKDAGCR